MNAQPPEQDAWSFIHDLIFAAPHPVLVALEGLTVLLFVAALTGLVVRIWKGDRFEIGPLKIERPDVVSKLETSLEELSRDDRLKANVLWMFRERLNQANRIISTGIEEPEVRSWCRDVLTDIITALSEGGHDRHRASLWVRSGNELCMYNGMGFRQEAVDRATLPLDSIAGNVLRTGLKCNSSNVDDDAGFCPKPRSGQAYKSLLAVPVSTAFGETIAALCIDAEAQGYFDGDHEFFASCFADLIALLAAQVIAGDLT